MCSQNIFEQPKHSVYLITSVPCLATLGACSCFPLFITYLAYENKNKLAFVGVFWRLNK